MPKSIKDQYNYTQNRELSWLRFDRRVLEEAADPSVPALERLKFISIFSSNLDEFFMVRVGSLFDNAHMTPEDRDNKTGWTPTEQIHHIYYTTPGLLTIKKQIYTAVMEELGRSGVQDLTPEALDADDLKQAALFFKTELLPVLSPIVIAPNHPVPHLANKLLYAVALLENKKGHASIGIVPVPENVPPYLLLSNGKRFVRTENILLHWLMTLFDAYSVKERCILAVTRNADISFNEEKFEDNEEDFSCHMKKLLKQRGYLSVVRLELNAAVSEELQRKLLSLVRIESYQMFVDTCPLNMRYIFRLIDELPKGLSSHLLYPAYHPRWAEDLLFEQSMFAQIHQRDRLLFYPYDSVEPFLRLLNEAAENPQVLSIKITIYRLASSSKIVQALCHAAENGKEVLVLMELRARFDEENNIAWSKILEESGCQVIYGMEGFKCHSKICLITLRSHNKTSYLTQIGTGNYNEKTNAMYTDLSLMTADFAIGEDAAAFFRNMLVNKLDGEYRQLYVSPFGIKSMMLEKIDRQIALGKDGFICIKANSITEREIIDKLAEASRAGVEIQLIIRGICCILPGVPGDTENVHITSIVGRFLEHARIYQFGRGENVEFYISSADLMTRNLNRRVEIACPVKDALLRGQLKWVLDSQLRDTAKASVVLSDGSYCRKHSTVPFNSQTYFMQQSPHIAAQPVRKPLKLRQRLKKLIAIVFHS